MTRRSPVRHKVKSHIKQGKRIKSYQRGFGVKPKRRRKVVHISSVAPSPTWVRNYRFDLRDIAPSGILSFEAKGKDVSDAMDNLAKELGEDPMDIEITLEAAYVWNPIKKEWMSPRPWWEEEKEPYEWE